MSYKPLSQTVTDGQKNPISSDAVNDHVAAEIAAIPASASLTLDNLTAPTAVNQNLNMGTNQLRFNSATRSASISLNALADVATGITTSANNSTTINTSASITNVLQIGDVIYLNGLTPRAVVLTKPSSTQITVSRALGDNTSREIYIEPQLLSIFDSTTNRLSITKQGYFSFASPNTSLILKTSPQLVATGTNNTIIGSGTTGNALTSGVNNTLIGTNVAPVMTTGGSNTFIGQQAGAAITTGHSNTAVGNGVLSAATTGTQNAVFGTASLNGVTTGNFNSGFGHELTNQAGAFGYGGVKLVTGSYNTFLGSHAGTMAADTSNAIVFGFNSIANSNECAIGGYNTHDPNKIAGRISTIFVGRGGREIPFNVATPVQILTQRATGTDTQLSAASLVLAGAAGTGTGIGSPVIIATAPASASTGSSLNAHVQRIRIEHDGRVGIGTPNPEAKLEVAGKVKLYDGDLEIGTLGKGLKIAEGADATVGVATLAAGTATVNTAAVKSNSRIMLTNQNPGGTVGFLHVSARTADTSFVITSSNAADTSDVAWVIINPLTVTDSDADTFITNASITDATQKRAVQRLVKSLKDESLWAKMKVIYPMVGGTEAAHKLNLKDPQDTDAAFRLVFVGHLNGAVNGITHNSRGIKFGGASNTGLGDTKFVPNTHFTAVNNFHISCYMYYDTENFRSGYVLGAATSGGGNLYFQADSENAAYTINNVTSTIDTIYKNFPVTGRPKSTFMLMDSGADKRGYLRTVHKDLYEIWARGAAATGTLPTHSLMLNGFNNNGTPNWSWASQADYFKTLQFVTIGDSLTTLEAYKLHAIIEQFQLELGRQV
jgi:flagellar assembly factor FliW